MVAMATTNQGANLTGYTGGAPLTPLGGNLTNLAAPAANYQIPAQVATGGSDPAASGGTASTTAGDVGNLLQLFGGLYGVYNSVQTNNSAQQVLAQSNPFGAYRGIYGNQLLQLMQNPSSVTSLPGYNFQLDQGVAALDRSALAPGGVGQGGGLDTQLTQYGQGLASSFYNNQVQTLSGLAGANIPPANPAQALQGVGGAATGLGSSIAGVAGKLPGAVQSISNLLQGGGPTGGGLTGDPSLYSGMTDPSTGAPYFLSNDPGLSYAGGGLDASGIGDMSSATSGLADNSTLFDMLGPSPAGGEAASAASSIAGQVGEAGAAPAGYGVLTSLEEPAAEAVAAPATASALPAGYDTMQAALTGQASLSPAASLADTTGNVGASSAAGGSLGLGLAGVGAVLGVAAYGASKPGTELGSGWYNTIGSNVGAGLSSGASPAQKLQAVTALQTVLSMQQTGQGSSGLSTDNNFNMNQAMGVLAPYGISSPAEAQQMILSLLNSISPGQMPTANSHPMIHQA